MSEEVLNNLFGSPGPCLTPWTRKFSYADHDVSNFMIIMSLDSIPIMGRLQKCCKSVIVFWCNWDGKSWRTLVFTLINTWSFLKMVLLNWGEVVMFVKLLESPVWTLSHIHSFMVKVHDRWPCSFCTYRPFTIYLCEVVNPVCQDNITWCNALERYGFCTNRKDGTEGELSGWVSLWQWHCYTRALVNCASTQVNI